MVKQFSFIGSFFMQPPKREPLGKKHDRVAFSCEDDALDTYLKKRASREATEVVSYAVVVDAIDDRARSFYEHYEFCAFPDRKLRLFLPMKTIADLFS
jgi:hypothetical protein